MLLKIVRTAYSRGRKVGLCLGAPGLNPYAEYSTEAIEWDLGWITAVREVITLKDAERRVRNGVQGASAVSDIEHLSKLT